MITMEDEKPPHAAAAVTGYLVSSVSPNQMPVAVNSTNTAVLGKFLPGLPVGSQAVAVIQAPGSQAMQLLNGAQPQGAGEGMQYAAPGGVIYALSQYSPFISLSSRLPTHSMISPPDLALDNSNLGPEDAETKGSTGSGGSNSASGLQETPICNEPGKCQAGGELRLNSLADDYSNLQVPDGFVLVGAKSPMLIGMTLVAAVDKRYLPSEGNSVAMLGFSGNCVGCGAAGFRYFTEFSTHINLKLATQPKKQKHLKYYVVKDRDGKWAKGPLIPWKGTETRKRNLPMYNVTPASYGKTPELLPPYTMYQRGDTTMSMVVNSPSLLLRTVDTHLPRKKVKLELDSMDNNAQSGAKEKVDSQTVSSGGQQTSEEYPLQPDVLPSPKPELEPSHLQFKVPVSLICGVRPVLLLCQSNTFKLPNTVNDIVISDLLVGCFDLPDTSCLPSASTSSTLIYSSSIMSTGVPSQTAEQQQNVLHSHMEQSAANTLLNMSATTCSASLSNTTTTTSWPQTSANTDSCKTTSSQYLSEGCSIGLPLSSAVLILIQYLAGLDEYNTIYREDIESHLYRARSEVAMSRHSQGLLSTFMSNPHQLSLTATLLASASRGRVKLISSSYSFQNGIYKALKWLHETYNLKSKKGTIPNFVVILSSPLSGPTEFCVLVTGIAHAKLLADSLGLQGIVHTPLVDDIKRLEKQFKLTSDALSFLLDAFDKSRDGKVFLPFKGLSRAMLEEDSAASLHPKVAPPILQLTSKKGIFSNQAFMAHQLLSQVCNIGENPGILELPSFCKVEFIIVVPHNISLYHQTVKRVCESGILLDLGLEAEECVDDFCVGEKYVLTYSDWSVSVHKWTTFVKRALKQSRSLFILIFDQGQSYCLPQGMPDVLPNLKEVFEATNVIPLFVTAVPYMFQSRQSFIDPDNEVYWTDAHHLSGLSTLIDEKSYRINDKDMLYFGIKEFCDSTRWCQQFPLIRHEETFDLVIPRANRLNDISYSVVHGYILTRLYQAAMMVAGGVKQAEPHCLLSIIQIVRDVIESPLRNRDGSGGMLMIRVPSVELGQYFHDTLKKTRDSLGFRFRFDIIFDDGQHPFTVEPHFLQRMQGWRKMNGMNEEKAEQWYPRCLEDLLDLPCFIIYSGKDRGGQTYPRSLKYCDLHLIDNGFLHRSTIEAEIGSVACYVTLSPTSNSLIASKPGMMSNVRGCVGTTYLDPSQIAKRLAVGPEEIPTPSDNCSGCNSMDSETPHEDNSSHFSSRYPLPVVLVSKCMWQVLHSDGPGFSKLLNLNSDPNTRWLGSNRPQFSNQNPDHQSRHYRRWTEARPARKVLTTPGTSSPPSPNRSGVDTGNEGSQSLFNIVCREKDVDSKQQEMQNDDGSDEEDDKEQYHPRCLLLSGPPQVGKTGAYLNFVRLLHRMLIRLKRVDVYDNRVSYAPALDPTEICGIEALHHPQWPDIDRVAETEFITKFLDSEFCSFSQVQLFSQLREPVNITRKKSKMVKTSSKITEVGGQQIVPVILSESAAHDTYHHCDTCKFYREGLGSGTTKNFECVIKMSEDVEEPPISVQFIVPAMHIKHFAVDPEQQIIKSMILPKVSTLTAIPKLLKHDTETTLVCRVKTPILMASTDGDEEGLLNLFHAMEETDYIHVTFIKQSQSARYQKNWPNHVFAVLPKEYDDASFGAVKQVMKVFMTQNYDLERERQGILEQPPDCQEDVWPMVVILADNVVMYQQAGKDNEQTSIDDDDKETMDADALSPAADTASLCEIIKQIESTPNVLRYGIIGLRPWSSTQVDVPMHGFIRTFVHSVVFLNVKQTRSVSFNMDKYIGENIDFQLRLVENNSLTCRFEHLSFMCKVTVRNGWRVPARVLEWETSSCSEDENKPAYAHFVTPPDLEDITEVDAAAHFVMQKYLSRAGSSMFPGAVGHPESPVLVVGGYVDLGRDVNVCVVNSDTSLEQYIDSSFESIFFGGLLLYGYTVEVTKEFLRRFRFSKEARLCIVSNERYAMREEVARLDLEENWRFRFRDEYQTSTATTNERKPVFFLTGSYC